MLASTAPVGHHTTRYRACVVLIAPAARLMPPAWCPVDTNVSLCDVTATQRVSVVGNFFTVIVSEMCHGRYGVFLNMSLPLH